MQKHTAVMVIQYSGMLTSAIRQWRQNNIVYEGDNEFSSNGTYIRNNSKMADADKCNQICQVGVGTRGKKNENEEAATHD